MFLRRKGLSVIHTFGRNFYACSSQLLSAATTSSEPKSSGAATVNGGSEAEFNEAEVLKRLRATYEDEARDNGVIPVFKRALLHGNRVAVKDCKGEFTFGRLYAAAKRLALKISNQCGSGSSARVCFLCPNESLYVVAQWAIWFSGQIAIPLSPRHSPELLEYYVKDSDATVLVCSAELEQLLGPIATKLDKKLILIDQASIPDAETVGNVLDPKTENVLQHGNKLVIEGAPQYDFYAKAKAMIVYTAGVTGRPKGVVLTHANLNAQIGSITNAWQVTEKDTVLHVLPLHHFHGVVNGLVTPLNVGAKVVMLPQFDSGAVWTHLLNVNMPMRDRISLFMAVPTIYALLIQEYDKIFAKNSNMIEYIKSHCKNKIRLMISGSAPLPETVFNRWLEITGHKLLERYGMTECGMALSNPFMQDKIRERRPKTVGRPLPNVEVKITEPGNPKNVLVQMKGEPDKGFWSPVDQPIFEPSSPTQSSSTPQSKETPAKPLLGDLLIRGPTVFSEYWGRPEETAGEFTDGWFKTGDTAAFEDGYFRILGRSSVDIIKTGGHRVSALEIESKLLEHPKIADCAVVGLPDATWGQQVAALIVPRRDAELTVEELREWGAQRLPTHAFPAVIKFATFLPQNAMGKVNKKELLKEAFAGDDVK